MRRWWIYIILYVFVGAFGWSPFVGTDIAKLVPVEVVWLERTDGRVCIETDCGDIGIGKTLSEALGDLHQTAAGTVFLDTAEYVIVKRGSQELLLQISEVLRPSCSVCVADSMPDLVKAAGYLGVHEPTAKMKDVNRSELPYLIERDGRLLLVENENADRTADSVADRRN